ncbi:AAA family ATPase [Lichenifustis flavocetrariae]|uniref:AAA family ATPase n=1 Tax=Lichenifustis flavocetrariae TaxID=2949735 RepID=A0AA41Z279_9HYPH|nr:AAA family ATPase [Lichenifustis flavocetrariae]MCW6509158.1 AAA family ATPase [Lichenifustis flavocetrariae]
MKTAILVNGVPASGKSTVAHGIADRLGCPLMTLDTVKDPLFEHFGTGDREHNRKLGRASYAIIFNAIGDWPDKTTVVIDAWFGFQPLEVLDRHLAAAGIGRVIEIWCHAPDSVVAERYRSRLGDRSPGHPGEAYIPELIVLNGCATPTGRAPVFDVDTSRPLAIETILTWVHDELRRDDKDLNRPTT